MWKRVHFNGDCPHFHILDEGASGEVGAAKEGAGGHAFLAGRLDFQEAECSVGCGYQNVFVAFTVYGARSLDWGAGDGFCRVDLEVLLSAVGGTEDGPGGGVW